MGTLNPNGTLTYVAGSGQSGLDSLVYRICDKLNPAVCDTALVVVRIEAPLQLLPKVYLQGALFGVTFSNPPANTVVDSLMRDELRTKNLIPLTSPYGFWNPTLPANTIAPAVLTVSGPDAIVDWVFVELRSAADPTVIVSSRSALLQRDGDIVELDGTSPIQVRAVTSESYFVAVRHRNHLAVMTASPIALTTLGRGGGLPPARHAYLRQGPCGHPPGTGRGGAGPRHVGGQRPARQCGDLPGYGQ